MQRYKSKRGKDSGVAAFKISDDYIIVQFVGGETYKYTYASANEETIEEMKQLALANEGLSSFISRENPPYESKW
jgi:hypothetical protein